MPLYSLNIAIFDTVRYIMLSLDCGRGSLIKLCGLRGIKFYDPQTSVDRTHRQHQPATHVVSCGQSTNDTTWVWCDCCDRHVIEARVSMLFVCAGWHGGLLCMLAYVHWWLRATVAVNSVCAGEQRTCESPFVHNIVRPLVIAWPRNVISFGVRSPLLGLLSSYLFPFRNTRLSMYWGSRRERR